MALFFYFLLLFLPCLNRLVISCMILNNGHAAVFCFVVFKMINMSSCAKANKPLSPKGTRFPLDHKRGKHHHSLLVAIDCRWACLVRQANRQAKEPEPGATDGLVGMSDSGCEEVP